MQCEVMTTSLETPGLQGQLHSSDGQCDLMLCVSVLTR